MNSNDNPLVSIIIPVHNVKEYLDQCIESVLHQSYTNIEIILVNDGSTDDSGVMCDIWAKKDKRINVIHKENEGLNYARKDGFVKSTGEYVTFLDSDDFFRKDNIQTSLKILVDNRAEVVIYASKEFADIDSRDEILASDEQHEMSMLATKEQIAQYAFFGDGNLSGIKHMTVWGKLYARNLVEKVDWSVANYRMYEDSFWTPQALLKSSRIVMTSSQLIYYRRNIAYGVAGDNLGNRLMGNSINGKAVGYIEYIEQMQEFYRNLARDCGLGSTLDEQIDQQSFLDKTWRIDNLVKAGLLDSENNLKFTLEILPRYIEAKNKHINNLDARIEYLSQNVAGLNQNLAESNAKITSLENDNMQLTGAKWRN